MKSCSEVPHIIIALIKKPVTHFKLAPKFIRSDNAKEYTVKPLLDYLDSVGSQIIFTSPYTLEQNGEAKRLNRTLGDIARTTLAHSGMPSTLWSDVYHCACYLINAAGPVFLLVIRTTNEGGYFGTWLLRKILTLGQERTKEVCKEQDSQVDLLQATSDADIPTTLRHALRSPAGDQWRKACISEWDQLTEINTFDIVDKLGKRLIGTMFVFDIKQNTDGSGNRLKARFVVQGFKQRLGKDVRSTFAPTASLLTLWILLTLAARNKWIINSFDITGEFIHSPIEETIYVDPPAELFPHLEGKVLNLQKALYGTRQASRCWWKHFKGLLHGCGFECDEVEECLYRYKKDDSVIIVWIHVDDGIVFGNNQKDIDILRQNMDQALWLKWDSKPDKLVGIRLEYKENAIFLSQHLLIDQILEKYKKEVKADLITTHTPLTGDNITTSTGETVLATLYQSFIGSINYLALGT
ncbi:hypothetical protein PtA15_10A322 [Puccinia triticina]|uniref:Integrase catalytic domain-containing protein n=1 Tax=Puccinia triticina TaxID=208348 RepID=A0ABY7CV90_9BASI|nr:uncharacterized protein PtA15_10A322 [Puccinia triticina]WAQ88900.1 hypothetical protein PtA15_10A322 [Puccinia triticina]